MTTFYDRSSNIDLGTGLPLTSLAFTPAYGSRVQFSSRANIYETQDSYYNLIPMSVNSIDAKFDLKFDLNEANAQKLVHFLENKSGHVLFPFTDASSFYKSISGVCDNYAVNHINNMHYEVAMSFEVNQAPTLLNWSGMTFINAPLTPWVASTNYKKYDVIYSGINANKLDNYFYCTEDHTSSFGSIDGPTGVSTKWTQSFFFEPDVAMQNDVNLRVTKLDFKNSFTQRIGTDKHLASTSFSYKFSSIDARQAKAIMHYLENKAGYRRFLHSPPSVYNQDKVFYAPSWSHTWKYYNSHDIEVSLMEDPLGIIPTSS